MRRINTKQEDLVLWIENFDTNVSVHITTCNTVAHQ